MLGICLGAQLMAAALGARVAPGPAKEIGWAPLTLTAAGQASVLAPLGTTPVLHWHGDNCELPSGLRAARSTPHCPVQAFLRTPSQLALQFHLETEPARLEAWLVGHTVELGKAGIDPRDVRAQAQTLGRGDALTSDAMCCRHGSTRSQEAGMSFPDIAAGLKAKCRSCADGCCRTSRSPN